MTINVEVLLRFFDEKPSWSEKHATSIASIVGEDLGAACFIQHLESKGDKAAVLTLPGTDRPRPVTTGMRKGPRLDRWIQVDWQNGLSTVFQTEIKSWSAHAKGGKRLALCADQDEVTQYKQARWDWHWDGHTLREPSAAKVLSRMKPPVGVCNESVLPLLIFWEPIGPRDQSGSPLFRIPIPGMPDGFKDFPELWVFSVSSYLRSISHTRIELNMPSAAHRLRLLTQLFSTGK